MTTQRIEDITRDGKLPSNTRPLGIAPIIYLTEGKEALCPDCANSLTSTPEVDEKRLPEDWEVLWHGAPVDCAECGKTIESVFGDGFSRVVTS